MKKMNHPGDEVCIRKTLLINNFQVKKKGRLEYVVDLIIAGV
ncbi:hypothetical protein MKMG_01967 [Methanogenium sp. MK-MG]|nr:hypothetical protein MKMG_01967 [Methanogenium sp. MK-MG]